MLFHCSISIPLHRFRFSRFSRIVLGLLRQQGRDGGGELDREELFARACEGRNKMW